MMECFLRQGPPGLKGQKGEPSYITDDGITVRSLKHIQVDSFLEDKRLVLFKTHIPCCSVWCLKDS